LPLPRKSVPCCRKKKRKYGENQDRRKAGKGGVGYLKSLSLCGGNLTRRKIPSHKKRGGPILPVWAGNGKGKGKIHSGR